MTSTPPTAPGSDSGWEQPTYNRPNEASTPGDINGVGAPNMQKPAAAGTEQSDTGATAGAPGASGWPFSNPAPSYTPPAAADTPPTAGAPSWAGATSRPADEPSYGPPPGQQPPAQQLPGQQPPAQQWGQPPAGATSTDSATPPPYWPAGAAYPPPGAGPQQGRGPQQPGAQQWGQPNAGQGYPPAPGAYGANPQWNAPTAMNSPYNTPQVVQKVPSVAWLVPVAALLAIIGAALPWFHGYASAPGKPDQSFKDSLYSYEDGRIGLLPPILLLVLSIGVVALLLGRQPARFSRGSAGPVVSAARGVVIAGVVSLVCVVIAWFLVPSQYKFDDGAGNKISWNDALREIRTQVPDATFSRGPQAGLWLTGVAAVIAIVVGVLMFVMKGKQTSSSPKA